MITFWWCFEFFMANNWKKKLFNALIHIIFTFWFDFKLKTFGIAGTSINIVHYFDRTLVIWLKKLIQLKKYDLSVSLDSSANCIGMHWNELYKLDVRLFYPAIQDLKNRLSLTLWIWMVSEIQNFVHDMCPKKTKHHDDSEHQHK